MHEAHERSPQGHGPLIRLCRVPVRQYVARLRQPFRTSFRLTAINERRKDMRSLLLRNTSLLLFLLASFAGLPLTLAVRNMKHCNKG